jgi:hypothetical protein
MTYDRGFMRKCDICGDWIDSSDYRAWGKCKQCRSKKGEPEMTEKPEISEEHKEHKDREEQEVSYIFTDYEIYAAPDDPRTFWGNSVFEFIGSNMIHAYEITVQKIAEKSNCDPKRIRLKQFYRI